MYILTIMVAQDGDFIKKRQKNSKFTNANNVYNALKRAIYKLLACIKEWSEQTEKRH